MRYFLAALIFWISQTVSVWAEEWGFYYGPDAGEHALLSYIETSSGPNIVRIQPYGEEGSVALLTTLDTFETGGKMLESLEQGTNVVFDVWFGETRYERTVEPENYVWKNFPNDNKVFIQFLMVWDDFVAMTEGKALFLNVGSIQNRFGLTNAEEGIQELFQVLREELG